MRAKLVYEISREKRRSPLSSVGVGRVGVLASKKMSELYPGWELLKTLRERVESAGWFGPFFESYYAAVSGLLVAPTSRVVCLRVKELRGEALEYFDELFGDEAALEKETFVFDNYYPGTKASLSVRCWLNDAYGAVRCKYWPMSSGEHDDVFFEV